MKHSNATLYVRDLIYQGKYGQSGREKSDTQEFRVSIEIKLSNPNKAALSDDLDHTYDYKHAIAIAQRVIEKENHVLIERAASRIGKRICMSEHVSEAVVTVEKTNGLENGTPGITIVSRRVTQESRDNLLDFDVVDVLQELQSSPGAISFPILTPLYIEKLLEDADWLDFVKQPETIGPKHVREDLSSVNVIPQDSLFHRLKADFQSSFWNKVCLADLRHNFNGDVKFNDMVLQLYEKGSKGISPHKDGKSRINLVCVFMLAGKGEFCLCSDRNGSNPIEIDSTPGNVIIMRAPGFMGENIQPLHFVRNITEKRITFGLRQVLV